MKRKVTMMTGIWNPATAEEQEKRDMKFYHQYKLFSDQISIDRQNESHLLYVNELFDYAIGNRQDMPEEFMKIINNPKLSKDSEETAQLLRDMNERQPENDEKEETDEQIRNNVELRELDSEIMPRNTDSMSNENNNNNNNNIKLIRDDREISSSEEWDDSASSD